MSTSSDDQPDASMISFNHYAYGAVIDWVYRNVAGISPVKNVPGYREIVFAPRPAIGFSFASAEVNTPYGLASISWSQGDVGNLQIKVVVPFGSKATLDLPVNGDSIIYLNGERVENRTTITHGTYFARVTNPKTVQYK